MLKPSQVTGFSNIPSVARSVSEIALGEVVKNRKIKGLSDYVGKVVAVKFYDDTLNINGEIYGILKGFKIYPMFGIQNDQKFNFVVLELEDPETNLIGRIALVDGDEHELFLARKAMDKYRKNPEVFIEPRGIVPIIRELPTN